MKKLKTIVVPEEKTVYYTDAIVTKVHEDSYNIKLSNGKSFLFVQNTSSLKFNSGDYVAILFFDEKQQSCRIIGKGKRLPIIGNIPEVIV